MREAKVLRAVVERPGSSLEELVAAAYDDTPVQAHGIATRSLLAHLEKLMAEGQVAPFGKGWQALGVTA